jgi:predicted phage terminase large subunit-like protein
MTELRPQIGPQEDFLASSADIAIFGGAAGCGKTFALLMEPLRHSHVQGFGAVVFRRTMPQITTEGGLWDTARGLYAPLSADFIENPYRVRFPSSTKIEFHHLQYDETVRSWDGSQIPLVCFDELQHFTEHQFFYMLSRNRSMCGVVPYVRATCNPDPDSFLRRFLAWWIDDESGFPIQERSGAIRWMVRLKNEIHWGDSREELIERFTGTYAPDEIMPKSVTFIPALLEHNRALLEANPEYRANLLALPEYEQQRLLYGNWNARPKAGDLFRRKDFTIVEPGTMVLKQTFRYWDRAASEQTEKRPDPDYTVGVKGGFGLDGFFYVTDVIRFRAGPYEVKEAVKKAAEQDSRSAEIVLEQDPGQAGVAEIADYIRALAGYSVVPVAARADKFTRWKPFATHVRAGNVRLVRGAWNDAFISELEALTDNPSDYGHDDQGDAAAGLFNHASSGSTSNGTVGVLPSF